jgi:hypothetical protein
MSTMMPFHNNDMTIYMWMIGYYVVAMKANVVHMAMGMP